MKQTSAGDFASDDEVEVAGQQTGPNIDDAEINVKQKSGFFFFFFFFFLPPFLLVFRCFFAFSSTLMS